VRRGPARIKTQHKKLAKYYPEVMLLAVGGTKFPITVSICPTFNIIGFTKTLPRRNDRFNQNCFCIFTYFSSVYKTAIMVVVAKATLELDGLGRDNGGFLGGDTRSSRSERFPINAVAFIEDRCKFSKSIVGFPSTVGFPLLIAT
jgi:hypothetical protein